MWLAGYKTALGSAGVNYYTPVFHHSTAIGMKKISPASLRALCRSLHGFRRGGAQMKENSHQSVQCSDLAFCSIHQSFHVPIPNPSLELIPHMRFNHILSPHGIRMIGHFGKGVTAVSGS